MTHTYVHGEGFVPNIYIQLGDMLAIMDEEQVVDDVVNSLVDMALDFDVQLDSPVAQESLYEECMVRLANYFTNQDDWDATSFAQSRVVSGMVSQ